MIVFILPSCAMCISVVRIRIFFLLLMILMINFKKKLFRNKILSFLSTTRSCLTWRKLWPLYNPLESRSSWRGQPPRPTLTNSSPPSLKARIANHVPALINSRQALILMHKICRIGRYMFYSRWSCILFISVLLRLYIKGIVSRYFREACEIF